MDAYDQPETTCTDELITIVRCGLLLLANQVEARLVRRSLLFTVTTCFGALKVSQTCLK
jgi:hypothetical protein